MDQKHLDKFKKKLEMLKAEILNVIEEHENQKNSSEALDEIDRAVESVEREMGFLISSNFRANLTNIEVALKKIEDGQYGKCMNCGNDIPLKRLQILPFAQYCMECQKNIEDNS